MIRVPIIRGAARVGGARVWCYMKVMGEGAAPSAALLPLRSGGEGASGVSSEAVGQGPVRGTDGGAGVQAGKR